MTFERVKLIFNPKAGPLRHTHLALRLVDICLRRAPFRYEVYTVEYKDHAVELASAAEREGFDAVVVVGGDGTVNAAARGLLHSRLPLGIVPIGSGNGLARGLGIPVSIRRSCQLLTEGTVRSIDAGRIRDRYFFVVAGLGFDAVVGKLFDDQSLRGPLPYFYFGFREFLTYEPETFILRFGERQITVPALLVTIANTRQWGNGAIIAPHAEPDDGLFDICVIHKVNLGQALFHLPKLFTGKIDRVRHYENYRSTEVEIVRERPGYFHVDGEPVEGGTHLRVSIDPKALRVIVPPPRQDRLEASSSY
ncbi:MAG: YegS/Rv2252/BmrU family lipid kinase [candidate division KSB1 bacterium]|nr:YegS/Rv2252/BmrU family lipid kinase [candidate division KSB1 bacterium]MDZ7338791.1 YegS/Rv2252/BmrU family lipid kinase [candidate division KSB1 bacterium]MDZ7386113.1 YegS/Rv2252/BmrU family lipid kinase [candidate division KSB1 bacterium]MDZ7391415.1 YegS/Rv2252/BmrU family lipid kinase [candidate division KSB1 bacterium]MDZ7413926.1 YegS/Rv2252/BmrU family lipid kinase [candidate division KSB1 bacterium]